jgi:hypothetical protein
MQNAERGILRKFSGLSRERRDGWSPYLIGRILKEAGEN